MNRDLLELLGELRRNRVMEVNYEEMRMLIDFLWYHDSEFKVTKIDEEVDSCMFHLI